MCPCLRVGQGSDREVPLFRYGSLIAALLTGIALFASSPAMACDEHPDAAQSTLRRQGTARNVLERVDRILDRRHVTAIKPLIEKLSAPKPSGLPANARYDASAGIFI
jgi:hypothetical protein